MGKNKNKKSSNPFINRQRFQHQVLQPQVRDKINMLVWGATPFVITGFGIVMKEILQGLYRQYPGVYNISQVAINYFGDFCEEQVITGGLQNGRFRQWPAAVHVSQNQMNPFGHQKFVDFIRSFEAEDIDLVWLFEDPFQVGGILPNTNPPTAFIDAVRNSLVSIGKRHVPIVTYFPIDGIPKKGWIDNIAKGEFPITYLNFGANSCKALNHSLDNRIRTIPHGVNTKEFFPVSQEEKRAFRRSMLGDSFADKFMILNVNRNQPRKLVPSNLLAFKEFQKQVPNSFIYLNMKPVDVGWNLIECCNAIGLEVGKDVLFPPNFNVQKGLSIQDLNLLFNSADVLTSTVTGGGWELAISQAFATRTSVLAPANTSHVELCGSQNDDSQRRGLLYKSGSRLAELLIFPHDNEVIRPLPDLDDLVNKLRFLYENPEFCRKMEDNAYNWALTELSWEKKVVPAFHSAFLEAKKLKQSRLVIPK